jgi:hypothetical protein
MEAFWEAIYRYFSQYCRDFQNYFFGARESSFQNTF